ISIFERITLMFNGYRVIALCISKAGSERHFDFIRALNSAAVTEGFRLFIYHTCSDLYWKTRSEEGDKAVFDLMDYDIIDAVIIFDEAFQDKEILDVISARAFEHNVPVISVGAEREGCISFLFGYEDGFEQVVRHVTEFHGARDICFIAGRKDEACSEQRIAVYKRVLADNGIEFSPDRLFYGDYWWGPTQTAVENIIASGNIPQAIVCANDMMAVTVCETLKKHGLAVPDDVIVTGFDGTHEAASCVPPITTCKCSFEQAVDKIMSAVKSIFESGSAGNVSEIGFSIDIYRSCGCQNERELLNMGELLKKAEDRFVRYQDDELTLYEMSERIMESSSPEELADFLRRYNFYDAAIILNNDCLDEKINPAKNVREKSFDDVMQVIYGHWEKTLPLPFERKRIVPNIDYIIKQENPVVFAALSFFGTPAGYVCFSFTVDADNYCKILQYVTALNNSIGSYRSLRHLKYTAESVEKMSKQDFMTGLCNRKGFYKMLPSVAEGAADGDRILVATVDIDGLKNINDRFGHDNGDFAIRSVADAVMELPLKNKICGRFGGDEIVVCALTSDEDPERKLISDIKTRLNCVNETSGKSFAVSASIGVCVSEREDFDFEDALKQSDDKMYIMKIGHPNRRRS
ncbi:MAG: GGDEF domain-containing protein, partial [Oscillospiraceae bacterium]